MGNSVPYHKRPDVRERERVRLLEVRRKTTEILNAAKDGPCVDCGIKYPAYVMDLDHRPGEVKKFALGGRGHHYPDKVMEEIAKCDLVCANCHRERTHGRRT